MDTRAAPLEGASHEVHHTPVATKPGSEESDKSSSLWGKVAFYWATGGVVAVLGIALTLFLALRNSDSEQPPEPQPPTATQQPVENKPVIDSIQVSSRPKGTSLDVTGHGWDNADDFDLFVVARPLGDQAGVWQTSPPAGGEPDGTWRTIFVVRPEGIEYTLVAVLVQPDPACESIDCAPALPGSPDDPSVVYASEPESVDA